MKKTMTRRRFAQQAAAMGALAALPARARAKRSNERIRLGFIGVGNRGDQLLDAFIPHEDAAIVALCDLYQPYLDAAGKKVKGAPALVTDYRALLDRKDVDAVVIATPDHWHALQFLDACQAGKDIYVEKPLSLTIAEGRRMANAAHSAKIVTQVGLMRRSAVYIQEAVELIKSGAIGKVTVAKCYHLRNESPMGIGRPADSAPPPGFNWEQWLGPAPLKPFNRNRAHYKFRWFYDYSGGQLTNFGAHYLDVIQWALGQDAPKRVAALGGKYAIDDNREIPDTMEAVWEYDKALVTFSQYNANGAAGNPGGWEMEFRGAEGTLYLADGPGYQLVPERVRTTELPALSPLRRKEDGEQGRAVRSVREPKSRKGSSDTRDHARNFLDCVKSRKPTNCPVEVGHRSTSATLLARLALLTGKMLTWDAKAERVTNDEEANRLLSYEYRKPRG